MTGPKRGRSLADQPTDPVVVIGLGRFGSALALQLTEQGTEVLAIDSNEKVVAAIASNLPNTAIADSTDVEALRQLGVPDFRRAVVSIGTDMQASILTTGLLSDLEIRDIWAKAVSQQHRDILMRVGAHHVVLPEHDMGERIAHLLAGRLLDYVEIDEDFAMIKTKPPRELVGVSLREARGRSSLKVTVVAVKREAGGPAAQFGPATGDTVLMYGDTILALGSLRDLERFSELG
jgi:trk system potassium uptake protein TrkA